MKADKKGQNMKINAQTAAIVTGGASGLGRASATALRSAGVRVAIFDMNAQAGEQVAQEIGATFCNVDVMDEDSTLAGFEKARAAQGQERIIIHCAGGSRVRGKIVSRDKQTGEIRRMSSQGFQDTAILNLVASFRICSMGAEGMLSLDPLEDGERGVITLTASVAAQDGQMGQVAYGSTKAGVNGLVLPVARDLMSEGIRVNSIMPGIFETPMMLGASDKVLDGLKASVPFPKRLGKPEEYASLAMELIRNSYFNGQNIRLDGGIRMAPR